ncbi:hypothetical protein C8A00DRAFT_36254 [Chaetomidium leptoderma]|uniref:DUF1275 domain protein n=1 Tax=Chaetomidium leptoderma TaxID=669021 RepID=A0AAN6VGY3_9PEZI|nr:hypothetical protein C8A00DRAFT_36254 [Chaetomidium leptoderma]
MPANERGVDEGSPLLRHSRAKPTVPSKPRWRRHLTEQVSRERADVVLVFCYLITGLLDSASISVWGSFVSMQTGNTIYIALGLASPSLSTRWIKSSVSVLSFCVGSFIFSRFHRFFSPKRRWVMCVSFTAQLLLTAVAASLVAVAGTGTGTGPPSDTEEVGWQVLVPIALLAFQSCGQAIISRALRHNALNSVALTANYCDLFSDVDLFAPRNAERNRRTAAPLCLLLGAFIGGKFAHSSVGVAGALWTATALKALVVVVWLVWPAKPRPIGET